MTSFFEKFKGHYKAGTFLWGAALMIWGVICIFMTFCRPELAEKSGTLAVGLLAVLGVVWSWFLQLAQKERHRVEDKEDARRLNQG